VDLSRSTLLEQQRLNYEHAAEITAFIREREPEGVTVSVDPGRRRGAKTAMPPATIITAGRKTST
jgi:hypothetical protein